MNRTLSIAASGMSGVEAKTSAIAQNLANINTAGYKSIRVEFQDVLYDNPKPAGDLSLDGSQMPTGIEIGQGVRVAGTYRQFGMGDIKNTGNPLDIAIEGYGFFQIQHPAGYMVFSRDGSFKTDNRGQIVNTDGFPLEPGITVPSSLTNISISSDGMVTGYRPDTHEGVELGRITLATFNNPLGLVALGHNLYGASAASGDPIMEIPAQNGVGRLASGSLEMSNVKPVEQMIDLIFSQRAYEMGTRIIQAADQMMGSTVNIR